MGRPQKAVSSSAPTKHSSTFIVERKLPLAYQTKNERLRKGRRVLLSMNGWHSPNWPQMLHCVEHDLRQRAAAIGLGGSAISVLMAQWMLLFTHPIALAVHRL